MTSLLAHTARARNTAAESENRIHDDATAARYGFRGGLVPGVTVYGYLTVPLVERFGRQWLEQGSVAVRFFHPVYEGDQVTIRLIDQPEMLITAETAEGAICAKATAQIDCDVEVPALAGYPQVPLPNPQDRPPAVRKSFVPGASLGTLEETLGGSDEHSVLVKLDERLPVYFGPKAPAHPVRLLEMSNRLLMHNFKLGPWIHAASEIQNYSTCVEGETVQARGRIAEVFERKGHEFVVLDVVLLCGTRLVQRVRHTAIYQPRFV
jgi:hypothetical protein